MSSPPLSSRDPRSPARSLDGLISRIFHHLELGWPPRGARGRPAGGRIAFQQSRRALRPALTEAASHSSLGEPWQERAQQGIKKPRAPFWEDDE